MPREESAVPVCAPLVRCDAHQGFVSCLRFSSLSIGGGLLASAGNDHAVRVWRVSMGGLLGRTSLERVWESCAAPEAGGHVGAVSALAWVDALQETTAAGALLFSGSWDGTLKCWEAERPLQRLRSGEAVVGAVPLATLNGHSSRITAVEAGGHVVVSTSADFTARLWRRYDPFVCLAIYHASVSDGVLTSLSVGRTIFVTGSESGGVLVWPLRAVPEKRENGSGSLTHPDRVVITGVQDDNAATSGESFNGSGALKKAPENFPRPDQAAGTGFGVLRSASYSMPAASYNGPRVAGQSSATRAASSSPDSLVSSSAPLLPVERLLYDAVGV